MDNLSADSLQAASLTATSLKVEDRTLWLLDQTKLPLTEQWLPMATEEQLFAAIVGLKVRGAPLIGIAAALFVGLKAREVSDPQHIEAMIDRLLESRPTAVNLRLNLEAMRDAISGGAEALEATALRLFREEADMNAAIAAAGQEVVAPLTPSDRHEKRCRILTHCNTGSLATIGVGTAIGVITAAAQRGAVDKVWVSETRPLLQGGRLTAYEMVKAGIEHQVITDSMAASLMAKGLVDLVVVGADRIAVNGDTANKIGTYALAVACQAHGVPFYVAAPATTYDAECPDGDAIPIEQRDAAEVKGFRFDPADAGAPHIRWVPEDSAVYNPAFDVTPARLVTGWILPGGVAYRPQHIAAKLQMAGA